MKKFILDIYNYDKIINNLITNNKFYSPFIFLCLGSKIMKI